MHSRSADAIADARAARAAALTPDARVRLVIGLSEEGLASFMTTHGLDRASAVLMGVRAMTARGYPRFTVDVDLLAAAER